MRKLKNNKLGHQAPKGSVVNSFNSVEIDGTFAYCASHNFLYNTDEEKEKLHFGKPCYYTDKRFFDGNGNFYHNTSIFRNRFNGISLKSCIRKTLNCKNIPAGTIVNFRKSWYFPEKEVDGSFLFKVKKENKLHIKYEVSDPTFFANFENCKYSRDLVNELRKNGFLVAVYGTNPNFLSSMVSTAASYCGEHVDTIDEEGQFAIAYGHGKKIGISSGKDSFRGYADGCENILWDKWDEFDKWSRCELIKKGMNINDVVEILKRPNEYEN